MSPEQIFDVLDCGNAQENWQAVVRAWKGRAAQCRSLAHQLRRDAEGATARADETAEDADNFEALAAALEKAAVTFPAPAQVDRSPEGEDPEERLHRNDESAVGATDAPKD
jgi:hypothetical protein